jgi:hypothetical protein
MLQAHAVMFTRAQAADYLKSKGIRTSVATLAKLACKGGGPKFRRDGRFVVYHAEHLDEWADRKLSPVVENTSQLPPIRKKKAA